MPSPGRIVCLAVLFVTLPSVAQDPRIATPDGSTLRLAPGDSGTLRLRVQSVTPVWTQMLAADAGDDEYEFVQIGDARGCAPLEPSVWGGFVTFDPTVADGDVECSYAVRRSTDSINDMSMDLWPLAGSGLPTGTGVALRFGTVPDMQLDVRPESAAWLPDGRAQGVVSLVVRQSSDVALTGVTAGFCWVVNYPGFVMDGNFAGGCSGPSPGGGFCFNGGYGFELPMLAPHAATTCRILLTSREAYSAPLFYPIQLITWLMRDAATGGGVLTTSSTMSSLVLDMDTIFRGRFE